MSKNIIELWREESINCLFKLASMKKVWPIWHNQINQYIPVTNASNLFNLGDRLYDIFYSTNETSPIAATNTSSEQSKVSTGGTIWEALVCWYLNLCLIGRNTIVIKHNKELIPQCIADAITVQYNSSPSNTESDLIALTFPNDPLISCDLNSLNLQNSGGKPIKITSKKGKYNTKKIIDAITEQLFDNVEIHIIQCKTNWNDNAQIPMLWDMVYSAQRFSRSITVGQNGRSINNNTFTYSFVTVPTVNPQKIKTDSVCVKRVENLSGGNYWGRPSQSGVAKNIKEMLQRNLSNGHSEAVLSTLRQEIEREDFQSKYDYFKIWNT